MTRKRGRQAAKTAPALIHAGALWKSLSSIIFAHAEYPRNVQKRLDISSKLAIIWDKPLGVNWRGRVYRSPLRFVDHVLT